MVRQIKYFGQDVVRMLGKHKIRILYIWLSREFWGVFVYRLDRGLSLVIGKYYKVVRIPLLPLFNLLQSYSNTDINYKADIKGGLLILHAAGGVVISGFAVIGSNLSLTGGNVIGSRPGSKFGDIAIGDGCNMGANAVILGPIKLGNHINVGASACAVKDCEVDHVSLIGVPAKMYGAQKTPGDSV